MGISFRERNDLSLRSHFSSLLTDAMQLARLVRSYTNVSNIAQSYVQLGSSLGHDPINRPSVTRRQTHSNGVQLANPRQLSAMRFETDTRRDEFLFGRKRQSLDSLAACMPEVRQRRQHGEVYRSCSSGVAVRTMYASDRM